MPSNKAANSPSHSRVNASVNAMTVDNVHGHKKTPMATVEYIKNRACRTEELTQRALRFNFQLAIDLRELLQAEFDSLEKLSNDPKVSTNQLKACMITLSNKILFEITKQQDLHKKIAEAYEAMFQETTKLSQDAAAELETLRITGDEHSEIAHLLNEVLNIIKEAVDYWTERPEAYHKKLVEIRKDNPRESMDLAGILDHIDSQMKRLSKTLEHPLAGYISISKEFTKLNIRRR